MGVTLQPEYNAQSFYGTQVPGQEEFAASFCMFHKVHKVTELGLIYFVAFFFMVMAIATFVFLIVSLRTNIVFFLVFFFIELAFIMLMATYWTLAEGKTAIASMCQTVSTSHRFLSRKPRNRR